MRVRVQCCGLGVDALQRYAVWPSWGSGISPFSKSRKLASQASAALPRGFCFQSTATKPQSNSPFCSRDTCFMVKLMVQSLFACFFKERKFRATSTRRVVLRCCAFVLGPAPSPLRASSRHWGLGRLELAALLGISRLAPDMAERNTMTTPERIPTPTPSYTEEREL